MGGEEAAAAAGVVVAGVVVAGVPAAAGVPPALATFLLLTS